MMDSQTFSLTVLSVNDRPVFISIPILEAFEDQEYQYQIEISDPDSDQFYYYFFLNIWIGFLFIPTI